MAHHFSAESNASSSASAELVLVWGPPPVYPIIMVTVTAQLLMHKISFVMNLVSSYYLLTQLCLKCLDSKSERTKEPHPLFKMQIDRSHVFYNDPGCPSAFLLHLLLHSCYT